MARTNIDIDDKLVEAVMMRYEITTKREAVDYALRALVGTPLSLSEIADMFGSMPDFATPSDQPPAQQ
jgi:Arc/MetJ family transcription regulator